jgi:threonine dehydratase
MQLPNLQEIESAQSVIYAAMPPTPQYSWPLLNQRLECEAWVKHENHSPVGAFKLRGALIYVRWLTKAYPHLTTVVAATRGNHGQGVGMAARLAGLRTIIVVPHGNSKEKNLAMQAQGVELIEHGEDFQAALEHAREIVANAGADAGYAFIESIHPCLVLGTATYALEFFRNTPALDAVYIPIGMGSSICGVTAARNALGLTTEIIGVGAAKAPAHAISFRERKVVEAPAQSQIADGLACRTPNPDALQTILDNVARIVEVSEAEIAAAMRFYYQDTHNLAEGAAAAALAGASQEKSFIAGKRIGLILTGANVDSDVFQRVLANTWEGAQ